MQHRIFVGVEQSPGQGFARVRIRSDSFEPLRRQPIELDWSRMTTVTETREQILAEFKGNIGLAYPDAAVAPGHPIHWHPKHRFGDLLAHLQAYVDRPLFHGRNVDNEAHAALQTLRQRFSRAENPSYVARRMESPAPTVAISWR